jgi:RimJ/RimL family protein N-acetyltransferase
MLPAFRRSSGSLGFGRPACPALVGAVAISGNCSTIKGASGSMEQFSTTRLAAERLQRRHLADLVALHLDPEVARYLGGVRSRPATETWLADSIAHWEQHGFGLWALQLHTGEFAGRAGIRHHVLDGADETEIVFTLKRALWGQGLASEIAHALVTFGLLQLKLPSLIGIVATGNAASRRVLEKSGFARESSRQTRGEAVVIYRLSPIAGRGDRPSATPA